MKRVLIVDDAATVRHYHRQVLEAAGYQVLDAANGLEGLEKALMALPDLVLADVNMPRMDGYSLLAALRAEPALAATPVIIITTEALARHEREAVEHGANLCLLKPVAPEALVQYADLLAGGAA
jgi:two-component system chemotaxis response regulator CheY